MTNLICRLCDGPAGDTTHEGDTVKGGFGSEKYDTASLIWLNSPPEPLRPGDYLCDDCIDNLIERRSLEVFASALDPDAGQNLSEAAFRSLFLYGARRMYRLCAEERGEFPFCASAPDGFSMQAVKRIRNRLSDGTALGTGQAHAVACLLIGCVAGPDPDFSEAAEIYAREATRELEWDSELLRQLGALHGIDKDAN